MNIGSKDLDALRETASKALIALLWLHVPIALAIGMARGADWLLPTLLTVALATAATLSWRAAGNGLSTNLLVAVALMGGVSVFTFQLSGHPWQIDMHMYFFAALACLVAYCDYRPILVGTVAVALHHLALNFIIPAAIFPGGADFGRVVLHAGILILEACVLLWVAHQLARLFETTAQKTAEAESATAAEARANANRAEADQKAKQENDAAMRRLATEFERKVGHIVEGRRRGCSRNAGHVLIDERHQRRSGATDGCGRHCIYSGLAQCRNGRLGGRAADSLDQRDRATGDALRQSYRKGGRRGPPHQHRGRGPSSRHP